MATAPAPPPLEPSTESDNSPEKKLPSPDPPASNKPDLPSPDPPASNKPDLPSRERSPDRNDPASLPEPKESAAVKVSSPGSDAPSGSPTEISGDAPPAKPQKKEFRIVVSENASEVAKQRAAALKPSESVWPNLSDLDSSSSGTTLPKENGALTDEAWGLLKQSIVTHKGQPVGTVAAFVTNDVSNHDSNQKRDVSNYDQVFIRDFVPSGLAYLMKEDPEPEIVKKFLMKTLHLQGSEKRIDCFTLGKGVLPASFKVNVNGKEELTPDFGGSAIGRVSPVDSGFWWIILLKAYTKITGDHSLTDLPEIQEGMQLILNLCLSEAFDTFPTLLCADGCCMIDRRMGVYGYPIEIQALFFFALRCAQQMLKPERGGKELLEQIDKRVTALSFHVREYFWLNFEQLNKIYRYKTEEYSNTASNKFNVIPESIPDWVFDFMPVKGGYFIGNVSPARMDFRWFLVGNCIAIISSLATKEQSMAIMDLIEARWDDLIGEMPLKITYPALEGHEWQIITGCDPKNTRWSYHNGGSWPCLLWMLTAACIKCGKPHMAKRAIELAEQRLSKDGWPEYYDGKKGRYIGKQARKLQTWSIAGYLVAHLLIDNPSNLRIISQEGSRKAAEPNLHRRSASI